MALTTYSELSSAIADWVNRPDLTPRIPDFITLAEAVFNRELRTADMIVTSDLSTTASVDAVALPAGWLEARSLVLQTDPKQVLQFLPPQELERRYAGASSARPVAYSVTGASLKLGPTPDAAYAIKAVHYQAIPALSDSSPANWLLTTHPDVYLYGALAQSAPYLGDDRRIQVWGALYERALEGVDRADNRTQWTGSPLQSAVDFHTP